MPFHSSGGSELSEEHAGDADRGRAPEASTASAVADGTVGLPSAPPVVDDVGRSPDASVCPFFRREVDGTLAIPVLQPDDANRCIAIGPPRRQSARQQELVCLRPAHADCPRYLRGAAPETRQPPPPRRLAAVPRATLAALLILAVSAAISFGFVLQRGGIDLPVTDGSPASTAMAAVEATRPGPSDAPEVTAPADAGAAPAGDPTPAPDPTRSPPATPALTVSPTLTPDPTPLPTATVALTPRPTKAPAATPKSDRYKVLSACPGRKGCWIYTVRAGDNLFSIANWFGVSLKTIYAWNPRYPAARLRAGDQIRMPPPTR